MKPAFELPFKKWKKEKKLKLRLPQTLFENYNWSALKIQACPICGSKLYEMLNKPFFHCKSKKHKGFIISKEKMERLLTK